MNHEHDPNLSPGLPAHFLEDGPCPICGSWGACEHDGEEVEAYLQGQTIERAEKNAEL